MNFSLQGKHCSSQMANSLFLAVVISHFYSTVYIEELSPLDNPDPAAQRKLSGWKEAVREAVHMSAREDGWALLSDVGNKLKEIGRDFDYRAYCHGDLLPLVKSCPEFETETGPDRVRSRSPD